ADDLALALKASRIRIQAPVPGRGYIGIEVPNSRTSIVSMDELVESPSFNTNPNPLKFPLGKNVAGQPYTADLADMPHLLIAGTTGSGKSVCLNAMLASYLLTLTPDQIRFMMVDPKRVELTGYNGIPHLLAPVIVDAEKVVGALQWMQREMDLRYRMFAEANVRNITEYNARKSAEGGKILPFYLIVIDELSDLMLLAPTETEKLLTRLAQLARATGIHLILATQRPSADIITGLIKANFPARIAFAVATMVDSRVIIDQPGAESLLGKGDMLFQAPDSPAPVRLQGTYVSETELNRLVDFWRKQAQQKTGEERPDIAVFPSQSRPPLVDDAQNQTPLWEETSKNSDEDPLTTEVIRIIRHEGRASVSLLQRKLHIGYTRSARIIENLEERGIIGPPNPQTGTREVLDYGEYGPLNED
ncbi:MAG: DNA translocase FtsK, partial [Anaerolineaceae bacterium]